MALDISHLLRTYLYSSIIINWLAGNCFISFEKNYLLAAMLSLGRAVGTQDMHR